VAHAADAYLLELGVLQRDQHIARDALVHKRVAVLLEPQVADVVGHLLGAPVDNQPRRADAAVPAVGEGGGRVLGAQRAGAGGRALVLGGQRRALDDAALKLVVGVRVLVVLGCVGHAVGCLGCALEEG
jgi:hypothetical protein